MAEFQQNPDGLILIRNGGKVYMDTKANFEADAGITLPALPNGVNDRIYVQGVRHALMGAGGVVGGGPMPWALADQVIAALDTLISTQSTRVAAANAVKAQALADQIAAANRNRVLFSDFISRWTTTEYNLLLKARALAVTNNSAGMAFVKSWDVVAAGGAIKLDGPTTQAFKASIVAAGILTQARADVIFN